MDTRFPLTLAQQIAAAQDWWREAGVDHDFADATEVWLREPEEEAPDTPVRPPIAMPVAEPVAKRPVIGGDQAQWPQTLEAFAEWWLAEPSLDIGGARPRIAPRGAAGASLMVLVPEPEAEDAETLLSGARGRLLSSFLRAAGIDPAEVYLASALARHTPAADWPALKADGLGAVTLHHIALAKPRRVIAFGRDILPLFGHDPAQNPAFLRNINHQGASFPLLAERSLDFLLARPNARAGFWQRWLDWTDGSN
ncbi:hypothetical protein SZ64_04725 [Erythrobacter sp. SG61-1L]|uniref:hypothetical protein n=1 Tax=Erythrobacter sp. SG61-1L TaxID=1603897 RepID=UPI0006C8E9D8|nr:hypothetical protein [Erythrobacter sp. SG61-1L]KPL67466.1 hypothetical protein SZ64_04725 [Erythrobacter sp. SG61-1L]